MDKTNLIKKHLLNENNKIIPQRCNKKYLTKHKLYKYIENSFDDSYTLSEKIYCLVNDIPERPKCKICGNTISFNSQRNYSTFCSRACANKDPDVIQKISNSVSLSLKKVYNERGEEIKQKRQKTLKEAYNENVTSPFGISVIKDQIRKTNIEKFGVDNVFKLDKFRSDGKEVSQHRSIKRNKLHGYDIEYIDVNYIKVKNLCPIHGDVTMKCNDFYNRTYRERGGIQCVICNPISSYSSFEIQFENLLNDLGIAEYEKNTKKVIQPYELDFYFPDKHIAFELNGVYWHSEYLKDKHYHKMKTELCESKNIRLFHIWEDDFFDKYEIIKSMISYIFKVNITTIHARKCKIKELSSKEYRNFVDENHIQGKINSSIKLGLVYNTEIVAAMGFGKMRIATGHQSLDNNYELHRFCVKKYTSIPGAASKLLTYFEKTNDYNKIITYAKRDYSDGNLYKKLNFTFVKYCNPGYYWVIDAKRKHRFNFRKDKITDEKNKHKTEVEIMHDMGYYRCYDSGNILYEKHITN